MTPFPIPDDLSIPAWLKLTPEQRAAGWQNFVPPPPSTWQSEALARERRLRETIEARREPREI